MRYYSRGDEAAFFAWLGGIGCVSGFEGRLRDLNITLARRPTDAELREFLALFHRYGVDMRQLARFETRTNRSWFRAEEMYWHKAVFG